MARSAPLIPLGYGTFARADRVYALVPLAGDERGDGRRTLVHVDGIDHIALVATQPSLPGEPIVAVARCIRLPGRPDTGEVAIVVADTLQKQGVGTRLVSRLAELAVAQGITRFRAMMLSENLGIQRLLTSLADGPVTRTYQGETMELELQRPGAQPLAA